MVLLSAKLSYHAAGRPCDVVAAGGEIFLHIGLIKKVF